MLETRVISKKQTSLGDERQSDFHEILYILRNNVNTSSEIINSFLEVLSLILRYHHAQNKGYVKNKASFGIELQSGLPEVLYILGNNKNTSSEIKKNFLEVLGLILKYHLARELGYVKKKRQVLELGDHLTSQGSYSRGNLKKQ